MRSTYVKLKHNEKPQLIQTMSRKFKFTPSSYTSNIPFIIIYLRSNNTPNLIPITNGILLISILLETA